MKFRGLVGSLLVWGSLPGWAMPGCSMPDCSMSDCSMSGCSMSGCSKLGRTMSGCSMSGRTMLGRTMSGWGTLALSGARSSCASGPSLEHLKKIEESPSSQEQKSDKKADAELLARALDYFSSEKFHECLILLQPLNRRYKLNPRYRAYLAVCLYYEWEYAEAIRLFDEVLPQLQGLAPHELSLYYWMDAESYFALQQYDRALPLYEKMLPLCRDNEKPDAYYRMGFCHLFAEERKKAKECFELSLEGYLKYRNTPNEKARIAQIRHMLGGLK